MVDLGVGVDLVEPHDVLGVAAVLDEVVPVRVVDGDDRVLGDVGRDALDDLVVDGRGVVGEGRPPQREVVGGRGEGQQTGEDDDAVRGQGGPAGAVGTGPIRPERRHSTSSRPTRARAQNGRTAMTYMPGR